MPARFTKTNRDYLWLLPNEFDYLVPLICNLDSTGFKYESLFGKSLTNRFETQFLVKAVVPTRSKSGEIFSMKSIRKHFATEWVKEYMEY